MWSRFDKRVQDALVKNGGDLEAALHVVPEGMARDAVRAAYDTGAVHTGNMSVHFADVGREKASKGVLGSRLKAVDPTSLDNAVYTGSHKLADRIENHVRGAQFLDAYLKNGGDAREALMRVIETHYDGDWISPFERGVMRRAVPFYTWTRQNFPAMLEAAAMQPMKTLGVMAHAKDVTEQYAPYDPFTPGFIRDNPTAIRTPLSVGLTDKQRDERYGARVTLMPDLPINDALGMIMGPTEVVARLHPLGQAVGSVALRGGEHNTLYDLQNKRHYDPYSEKLGGAKAFVAHFLGLPESRVTADMIDRFAPLADIADRLILPWLGKEHANPRDFDKRVTGALSSGAGITSVTESRPMLRAEAKSRGQLLEIDKGDGSFPSVTPPRRVDVDAEMAKILAEYKRRKHKKKK